MAEFGTLGLALSALVLLVAGTAGATCVINMGEWQISLGSEVDCLAPTVLGPIGFQQIGPIPVNIYNTMSSDFNINMYTQTGQPSASLGSYSFPVLAKTYVFSSL